METPSAQITFASTLALHGFDALRRVRLDTLQVNVGKFCNQACQHCHVDAGPKRTERMSRETVQRIIELLQNTPEVETVDITGGAPELNPNFRTLVRESRRLDKRVIDRCNLTVLLEPGQEDLLDFLREQQVDIIASLPCYTAENVDKQRGRGVFERSINALRLLNSAGYGRTGSAFRLDLVFNPGGASLPPAQEGLEREYKHHLQEEFGIEFGRLLTITNMPIRRFSDYLVRIGQQQSYQTLLTNSFNANTVERVMCRYLISVSWNGWLYDCDFNQMLEMPSTRRVSIWDIESLDQLAGDEIQVGDHCFGCTAGPGSSCSGQLS